MRHASCGPLRGLAEEGEKELVPPGDGELNDHQWECVAEARVNKLFGCS